MELFDKKYVYFMWDDELEGKKVFASNNIYQLIVNVDTNNDGCLRKNFIKEEFDKQWWKFVYYDPNYDVKWSYYKENKKVQAKLKDFPEAEWKNIERPQWESNYEWRIQPEETVSESFAKKLEDELIEEYGVDNKDFIYDYGHNKDKVKEKKYRPFKDCDELIETFEKKSEKKLKKITNSNAFIDIDLYKSLIWVRNKEYDSVHLITSFSEIKATNTQVVEISNMNFTMKELFDSFEFLNSSPCGVEE